MKSILLALIATLVVLPASAADTLTYKELVHRLYDLDHLAVPPAAGEFGALASSYDRASKYDAATDKYINWGANGDGGGIIRKEGDLSVLAEIKGPGVIWRTWSATADTKEKGHVKIYLDGDAAPVLDMPFISYFDHTFAPFTRPNLVYKTAANGYDNFTPIPFLKSCKIVAEKGWGNYYHFNYTTFPEGTVVPTFKLPLSDEDSAALDAADKVMGQCGQDPAGTRAGAETKTAAVTVSAGDKATVAKLSGEGAITALKVKFDLPADKEAQKNFLRQLVVSIKWDGNKEPAVWSPIGDFFGDAVIPAKYQSLPTGILEDGTYYAYWYMPYASGAHIEVQNDSDHSVVMNWEVTHAPLTQPVGSLLRFHAKWHRDPPTPMRPDRKPDWPLLETDGAGRYVGTQLHIWNPRGNWWGEGDEKWFVDGEKFPSSFGTGSEDYFGFAWSSGHTFNQALHGQPVNENNSGHVSVHRWHIADNIPFHKTFEGIIEKYNPNERPTLYAAVAFWYLTPDGNDPYGPVPVSERIGYWPPLVIFHEPGVIEGEMMKELIPHQPTNDQETWEFGKNWSGDRQKLWRPKAIGEHAEWEVKPPKAGKYKFLIRFSHAPEYGIVQVSLNGTKLGAPMDLYGEKFAPADATDLGVVDLKDGTNTMALDVTGKNDKSKNFFAGFDYVKLVPVP
jgi:hypothetical protein